MAFDVIVARAETHFLFISSRSNLSWPCRGLAAALPWLWLWLLLLP
ncbi:hypothetical protein LG3211_2173 [Lysobacter gummosus]|nr:hypothetical protein LG3211_2173 [Lysobacter gummosus]